MSQVLLKLIYFNISNHLPYLKTNLPKVEEIERDATVCRYLFTAKLHVSGLHRAHHQEYIKL